MHIRKQSSHFFWKIIDLSIEYIYLLLVGSLLAKKYVDKKNLKVPVYYDLSYSAAHSYHIETLPVTVFIDENGYISNIHQGSLTKSQIKEYIIAIGTDNDQLK